MDKITAYDVRSPRQLIDKINGNFDEIMESVFGMTYRFSVNVNSDGGTIDKDALAAAWDLLPDKAKNDALSVIMPGAYAQGIVYGMAPKTGEIAAKYTYSRSTTGTYFDKSRSLNISPANTPRIDWIHYGRLALLLEKESTNVLLNSKFPTGTPVTQSEWFNYFATAGALVHSDSGNTTLYLNSNVVLDTTYAFSAFAQRADKGAITVGAANNNNFQLIMGGAAGGGNATTLAPLIIKNGIFKIKGYRTATTTGSLASGALKLPSQVAVNSLLTGYQLEQGSLATSYIPTESTTQTRAADSLIIPISANGTLALETAQGDVVTQAVIGGDTVDLAALAVDYGNVVWAAIFDHTVTEADLT